MDVVIVNWNSGSDLKNCIQSIVNNSLNNINSIIIVDNASTDDSNKNIANLDPRIRLLRNDKNMGFAKACNLGAAQCNSNFILFLNPDTVFINNPLKEILNLFEKRKDVGIIGIQNINENGEIVKSCSRKPSTLNIISGILGIDLFFPGLGMKMREWDHNTDRYVDQVIGAFFCIRKEIFLQLNGFDERFFMYFEEVDLSLRTNKLNFKSYFLSKESIVHIGGNSSKNVKQKRLEYNTISRIQYFKKNHSFLSYITILFFSLLIEPLTRIMKSVLTSRNSTHEIRLIFRAYDNILSATLFK